VVPSPAAPDLGEPVLAELPASLVAHPAFAPYLPYYPPDVEGSPRLVAAPARSAGALAYERAIVEEDRLHIRPADLHDTLNALVWRAFPQAKRAISRLHVQLGVDPCAANARPRRRDVLTLFDEAGLLLVSNSAAGMAACHAVHDWRALFVDARAQWGRAIQPIVFGHGALEQMASSIARQSRGIIPRGLTLKAIWLDAEAALPHAEIDRRLAAAIAEGRHLAADERPLPLPVIGIPGWFAESASDALYADQTIFRPPRSALRP